MSGLSAKQETAVAALLTEATIGGAAAKVGVTERTLHRWLDDPDFAEAYRAARREAVQQAISRLQQVSTHAVTVLLSLMADQTVAPGVRLWAAEKVLDLALRTVELEDLQQRIEALEQAYASRQ